MILCIKVFSAERLVDSLSDLAEVHQNRSAYARCCIAAVRVFMRWTPGADGLRSTRNGRRVIHGRPTARL